jgi:hypothetical protein
LALDQHLLLFDAGRSERWFERAAYALARVGRGAEGLEIADDGRSRMPNQGEIPEGCEFELIETLRWTRSAGLYLLEEHVARLRQSAAQLRCEEQDLRVGLARSVEARTEETLRVRLALRREGVVAINAEPLTLPRPGTRWRLAYAAARLPRAALAQEAPAKGAGQEAACGGRRQ